MNFIKLFSSIVIVLLLLLNKGFAQSCPTNQFITVDNQTSCTIEFKFECCNGNLTPNNCLSLSANTSNTYNINNFSCTNWFGIDIFSSMCSCGTCGSCTPGQQLVSVGGCTNFKTYTCCGTTYDVDIICGASLMIQIQ